MELHVPVCLFRGLNDAKPQQESHHISCCTMIIVGGAVAHIRQSPPVSPNGPRTQVHQLEVVDSRDHRGEMQRERMVLLHGNHLYLGLCLSSNASVNNVSCQLAEGGGQTGDNPHEGTDGAVYHDTNTTSGLGTSRVTSTPHRQRSNVSPHLGNHGGDHAPSVSITSTRQREHSCDHEPPWNSPETNQDFHNNVEHVSQIITSTLAIWRCGMIAFFFFVFIHLQDDHEVAEEFEQPQHEVSQSIGL